MFRFFGKDSELSGLDRQFSDATREINRIKKERDRLSKQIKQEKALQDSLYEKYQSDKTLMNRRYEENQQDNAVLQEKKAEIKKIKRLTNPMAAEMRRCFSLSREAYQNGQKQEAKDYSNKGKELKALLQDYNAQVKDLYQELDRLKGASQSQNDPAWQSVRGGFEASKKEFFEQRDKVQELIQQKRALNEALQPLCDERKGVMKAQKNRVSDLKAINRNRKIVKYLKTGRWKWF